MKRVIRTAFTVTAAALLAVSCSYEVRHNPLFDGNPVPARPCIISSDSTLLVVRDYFPAIGSVDGISCDDYAIVPVSAGDMDTVLLVSTQESRKVSMLRVTTGDESGVIVLKRRTARTGTEPSIATVGSNMGGREFTVRVKNSPASYLVLWQNTPLDHKFLSYRKDGEFTVRIPVNALEMEQSYIRIYSFNAEGAGNDIVIPVHDGRVTISSGLASVKVDQKRK